AISTNAIEPPARATGPSGNFRPVAMTLMSSISASLIPQTGRRAPGGSTVFIGVPRIGIARPSWIYLDRNSTALDSEDAEIKSSREVEFTMANTNLASLRALTFDNTE